MHAGAADRHGQTVGSLVCELNRERTVHWVTGTAAPCISIFKPVLMDVPLPSVGLSPGARFDSDQLWWRHERLHRAALASDFGRFIADIRAERDAVEDEFRIRVAAVLNDGRAVERARVIDECWRRAEELEAKWHARLRPISVDHPADYPQAWQELSQLAGIPEMG